jgi:cytochrome c551/c552
MLEASSSGSTKPGAKVTMENKFKRLIGLIGLVFVLVVMSNLEQRRVTATSSTQADARAVVQKVCGAACHALERVTVTPRSRAQWEDVISKMISMGAKGTDEELATVLIRSKSPSMIR